MPRLERLQPVMPHPRRQRVVRLILSRPARTQAAHRQRHCRHRLCRRRQAAQLFADIHRLPFSAYARAVRKLAAGRHHSRCANMHIIVARSHRHVHCGPARRDRGRPAGLPVGNPARRRSCLQLSRLMRSVVVLSNRMRWPGSTWPTIRTCRRTARTCQRRRSSAIPRCCAALSSPSVRAVVPGLMASPCSVQTC